MILHGFTNAAKATATVTQRGASRALFLARECRARGTVGRAPRAVTSSRAPTPLRDMSPAQLETHISHLLAEDADLKHMLRELAEADTFQRSILDFVPEDSTVERVARLLEAHQSLDAILEACILIEVASVKVATRRLLGFLGALQASLHAALEERDRRRPYQRRQQQPCASASAAVAVATSQATAGAVNTSSVGVSVSGGAAQQQRPSVDISSCTAIAAAASPASASSSATSAASIAGSVAMAAAPLCPNSNSLQREPITNASPLPPRPPLPPRLPTGHYMASTRPLPPQQHQPGPRPSQSLCSAAAAATETREGSSRSGSGGNSGKAAAAVRICGPWDALFAEVAKGDEEGECQWAHGFAVVSISGIDPTSSVAASLAS